MDVIIAFFGLGLLASLFKADWELPEALYKSLTIFLMLAIGLKGGEAMVEFIGPELLVQGLAVVLMGVVLPFIAYPLLRHCGGLSRIDSASIAAHYGSVSVGTYAVAIAVLESSGISYEPYFPLFVVLLEIPAIIVGLLIAEKSKFMTNAKTVLHEILTSQGIFLMVGGLVIGAFFASSVGKIMPLFGDLFQGALALFLLQMGLIAGKRLLELKSIAVFIASFGVLMPLIGATVGGLLGIALGLSAGGVVLLAVLGGSASYIAVPAAMSVALPKADHGLSITSSLGVTFPFNVLVAIPLYVGLAKWFYGV